MVRPILCHKRIKWLLLGETGDHDDLDDLKQKLVEGRTKHITECTRFKEAVRLGIKNGHRQMGQLFIDLFMNWRALEDSVCEISERVLVMAALIGDELVVRELLDSGVDINCFSSHESYTIKCAARNGHVTIVCTSKYDT